MNVLAGTMLARTGTLIRLALRRDRYLLPVWLYALTAMVASTAFELVRLYPSAAERAALAATAGSNPSLLALYGAVPAASAGGITVWRIGVVTALGAALMSITTVIRHSRGNEEAGRLELVRAGAVGRLAAPAAAMAVALGACAVLAGLVTGGAAAVGLPVAGSVAMGVSIAAAGWAFAGVAAVCAELTASARAARGAAMSVLGLAYLARAAGDASPHMSWLTWASPLGWAEQVRPFGPQRWWPAVLAAGAGMVLAGVAGTITARRDAGAGVLASRSGRPGAAGWLQGPVALAWRLQRGSLLGWAIGVAVGGVVLGGIARGIGELLQASPQAEAVITRMGGRAGLIDAYFVEVCAMTGIVAAAFAVAAALRLVAEESGQRAAPVLAAPVGRLKWAAGHLLMALAGPAVLLAIAGAGAGLASGLLAGPGAGGGVAGQVPRLVAAALAQLPAAWLIAGLTVAVFGLAPRAAAGAGWGALAVAALLTLIGPAINLSHWVLDASPFGQIPRLPGGAFAATPLIWLTAATLALIGVGLTGLRQRDVA